MKTHPSVDRIIGMKTMQEATPNDRLFPVAARPARNSANPAKPFTLCVEQAGTPGRRRRFTFAQDRVGLGRALSCDVSLESPLKLVSRAHAEIRREAGGFWLVDLGSKNPTRLNGETLEAGHRYGLRCGDRFVLGDFVVEFIA